MGRGAGGPGVRAGKGVLERLHTAPPEGGVVVGLDGMGPNAARRSLGRRPVKPAPPKAQRATPEIDDGRRGRGCLCGAFRPAAGEAFTAPYTGRTTANRVDVLAAAAGWINADAERVDTVADTLNVHSATEVPLFALAHPRRGFVCQPNYAAYLNLIKP